MAEISNHQSGGGGRGKKVRSKKIKTKIDMTPMVDLAFLLLTFFILATTFLRPMAMEIAMPEKSQKPQPINISNVLSLTLGESNKIYYTVGSDEKMRVTNYSVGGIRKVLMETYRSNPKLYVIIKATDKANYQNVVDIFDEMDILQIPRYSLVDITPQDIEKIKNI